MNSWNSGGEVARAAATARVVADDDAARRRLQSRTFRVVVLSQVLGGAGLAAGITVGALLAEDMLGSDRYGGLPTALFTLGSALAAFLVGRLTQRSGRRPGLGLGFAVGGIGAFGVVLAAGLGSVGLLFAALFVYGAGTSTNLQARYAGADLATPDERGRAVSIAMVSTTLGAVAGPNLVEPMGGVARALGLPELAGPFLLAGVAYLAAGLTLLVLLRPDPFLVAREVEALRVTRAPVPAGGGPTEDAPVAEAPARPGIGATLGGIVMVASHVSMVAVMTMTPVHMRAHGHEMGAVGLVIGLHIAAMYLPSLLTGALVDRVGRGPVVVASALTLLLAGVTGALAPGEGMIGITLALVLLGLGWNFGLIAGTSLVVDATVPANRARTQGSLDVLVALGGAGGGAVSGVIVSGTSYAVLSLAGGVLGLVMVPALLWAVHRRRTAVVDPVPA